VSKKQDVLEYFATPYPMSLYVTYIRDKFVTHRDLSLQQSNGFETTP